MHNIELTEALRSARRSLELIQGYRLIEDFYWDNQFKHWGFYFSLTLEGYENEFIPETTFWRVLISPSYPKGNIWIFPDSEKGIVHTFPHQEFNDTTGFNWRSGKLCLSTQLGSWGRKKFESEPFTANKRLGWHIKRCSEWLKSAVKESLHEVGDPFELPDFPFKAKRKLKLIFNEDYESFLQWKNVNQKFGILEFYDISQNGKYLKDTFKVSRLFIGSSLESFFDKNTFFENIPEKVSRGFWVMMENIPVLRPWQLAKNFGELKAICKAQGIDLFSLVLKAYKLVKRSNKSLQLIMLGFPVPEKIGETPSLIHWFSLWLPISKRKINGFRPNSEALWATELSELLYDSRDINWMTTENWNKAQVTNRGRIDVKLQDAKILLIGAGSVGSSFIELFARLGCSEITIVDGDVLKVGNLSRHSLTLKEVGNNKAEMLAEKLKSIFPFVHSKGKNDKIQNILLKEPEFLIDFDIIIDATAEDDVLDCLEHSINIEGKFIVSISTGYNADRLYCYTLRTTENTFGLSNLFKLKIDKWIEKDKEIMTGKEELIEGVGCWHPLFPARIDDIQMLTSTAFKIVEKEFINGTEAKMTIIEKTVDGDNQFSGLNITHG